MALPTDLTTLPVVGKYVEDDTGAPAAGTLTFEPSNRLTSPATSTTVLNGPIHAILDTGGHVVAADGTPLRLPATDDPDINPVGWYYLVTERFAGHSTYTWLMDAPTAEGTIDLARKAEQVLDVVSYRTVTMVNGFKPDADGNVEIPLAASGVETVNTVAPDGSGNVALTASNVGALSTTTGGTVDGPVKVTDRFLTLDPDNLSTGLASAGPDSAYFAIVKGNTANDATVVFLDQAAVKGEIGIAADSDIHVKTVTGPAGSETFRDSLICKNDTAYVWVPTRLGVGTVPVELFHVSANQGTTRVLAKIENASTSAGNSVALQLAGRAANWIIGTDVGLSGGDNVMIVSNNGPYMTGILINGSGNVGVGTDSPVYALDVNGSVATKTAGQGFRIREGTNAKQGVATIAASGTSVTVSTTAVASTSRIHLTPQAVGSSNPLAVGVQTITAGTSFVIKSATTAPTGGQQIAWTILDPA